MKFELENVKINSLEIENVKRVKAVKVQPSKNGLTIIGGRNNQGKTSVLDSIAWALGGDRYRPSKAQREGSVVPPSLKVTLDNGIIVERKGKNSDLKVTDPSGKKAGQQLLNCFIEQLALDLPKFMQASGKEKAQTDKSHLHDRCNSAHRRDRPFCRRHDCRGHFLLSQAVRSARLSLTQTRMTPMRNQKINMARG